MWLRPLGAAHKGLLFVEELPFGVPVKLAEVWAPSGLGLLSCWLLLSTGAKEKQTKGTRTRAFFLGVPLAPSTGKA